MTKYEIILYWSSEDDAFIAEVPELAGCAADGATRQEALANVEVIIAEWMQLGIHLTQVAPISSFGRSGKISQNTGGVRSSLLD